MHDKLDLIYLGTEGFSFARDAYDASRSSDPNKNSPVQHSSAYPDAGLWDYLWTMPVEAYAQPHMNAEPALGWLAIGHAGPLEIEADSSDVAAEPANGFGPANSHATYPWIPGEPGIAPVLYETAYGGFAAVEADGFEAGAYETGGYDMGSDAAAGRE